MLLLKPPGGWIGPEEGHSTSRKKQMNAAIIYFYRPSKCIYNYPQPDRPRPCHDPTKAHYHQCCNLIPKLQCVSQLAQETYLSSRHQKEEGNPEEVLFQPRKEAKTMRSGVVYV